MQAPLFGIVGWKNSGKTGLVERLVFEISKQGFSVSTIKHAHHAFEIDHPGKDSDRHRKAGAKEVMISSANRWVLMHENERKLEPTLDDLVAKMLVTDLILIEGFKNGAHSKIEAHRAQASSDILALNDKTIKAIASDEPLKDTVIPVFELNDTSLIAQFILKEVSLI